MKPGMETKTYPRYLFDLDFGSLPAQKEPEEDELAEVAPPTFSEEELRVERENAWEAGRNKGIADSNSGFEQQISATITEIDRQFSSLHQKQLETNEVIARSAIKVAAAIAAKIAPEYARQNAFAEVESFVGQCMTNLFGEVELAIHVPEDLVSALSQRLTPLAAKHGLQNGIEVVAGPEMGPSDCKIVWSDGGAERNGDMLLASIDELVNRFLEHSQEQPDSEETVPETPEAAVQEETQSDETDSTAADTIEDVPEAKDDIEALAEPEPNAHAENQPDIGTAADNIVEPPAAPVDPFADVAEVQDSQTFEPEPDAADDQAPPDAPIEVAPSSPAEDTSPAPALPGAIASSPAPPDVPAGPPGLPGAISPDGDESPPKPSDPAKT